MYPRIPSQITLKINVSTSRFVIVPAEKREELVKMRIRSPQSLLYIDLESVHFQDSNDDYASKAARTEQEACSLIECGFECVCDFNGAKLFRKRK